MPEAHFAVLEKYCLDCHDASTEKGGVNLEDLSFKMDHIASAELWQKVLNVTNSGEMPPEDKKQITDAEKTDFLADLSNQLVVARKALSDTGGVITMRRLNRREYENTIESLLGVKIRAEDLPDDSNSGGFDTTGSALFFSSDQFEQYLKIAERALDKAITFGPRPETIVKRIELETYAEPRIRKMADAHLKVFERAEAWRNSGGKLPTEFGFIDEARIDFEVSQYERNYPTFLAYLNHPDSKTGMPLYNFFRGCTGPVVTLPSKHETGNYKIRARIAVLNDSVPEHRKYIEYGSITTGSKPGVINVEGFRKIRGTMEDPEVIELDYSPGDSGNFSFMIREKHINQAEATKRFFIQSLAKTNLGPPPSLWVDWVEWEGPFYEDWPSQSHKQLFFRKQKKQELADYHQRVIENFAKRAFRTKEPAPAFLEKLYKVYHDEINYGKKPIEALKKALSIILASPGFLYLNEPVFQKDHRELSDRELAVRLSYFLWSGPPDAELVESAKSGDLKSDSELQKQTARMLRDERADEFIAAFTHQWLHMERLDFFQFNYLKYPRFDESTKESARREVYETIKDSILKGRPIRELLKSDHLVINNLLADYYGIEGVEGEAYRRVKVPPGLPRGGLPGMAAVMAMGSDGERSSPVERGAWILRSLLNDAPPPAPANVPQLSRLDGKQLSAREMQKAHQEEPQCAQCHRKIDPLGFGLENFDAVGLWRTAEVFQLSKAEQRKAKQSGKPTSLKIPIDASGTMPDGSEFSDFFELRDRIAERDEAFARGFVENLIEYALGRPFGFSDYDLADDLMEQARAKDYAMSEFIFGVVLSKRFKLK